MDDQSRISTSSPPERMRMPDDYEDTWRTEQTGFFNDMINVLSCRVVRPHMIN